MFQINGKWLRVINTIMLPYNGKVWRGECLANLSVWWKKVLQMNRLAKELFIDTTNLNGFSLVNRRGFAKFTKLSASQTFPLYSI